MMAEIEYIWHGRRYWTMEPNENEIIGWNTRFEPCFVLRKTAKRIFIKSPTFGDMQLNRQEFERDGKVYHTRVHEYFYNRPFVEKKVARNPKTEVALSLLGLQYPTTHRAIKRAYKQMAKVCHPDFGGSHEAFIKLNEAYEAAMKII
jgi:hypothetical protein